MTLALFRRRECVVPTFRGCLVLLLLGSALAVGLLLGVYPFLAVNDPKYGGILVVEGWGSEEAMIEVIEEFRRNRYTGLYSTGGPIEESSPLVEYRTFAEYGAVVLERLGCDPNVLHAVPAPKVVKDRTYSSAVALRGWLDERGIPVKTVNVFSTGAHSRRSRLLYDKAFQGTAEIGILASADREFDARRWWTSSAGFRTVTGEVIAYLYARLLFRPSAE